MGQHGRFSSGPKVEWLTDGYGPDRNMQLLEDFIYTDPGNKDWKAGKGRIVNGASIPRALWITVGAPYVGDYRKASVVHDTACEDADRAHPGRGANWDRDRLAADRMFRLACLAGGCNPAQATIMYLGVRAGAVMLARGIQPPDGGLVVGDVNTIAGGDNQWAFRSRPALPEWDRVALHVISSLQEEVIAQATTGSQVTDAYLDTLDQNIASLIP